MASHYRLESLRLFNNQAISSTTAYTSPAVNILMLDNVFFQLNVTGTPTGSAVIQVSADHQQDALGNVTVAGNWVTITTLTINGANVFGEDLNQLGAPWLRVVYTNATSTGHISAFVSGKGLM